ncbi:MAG: hypothetical protein FWC80_03835 [Firmicutes bacterium]|nr:hypothetical protein [Bacillota bacterium]
MDNNQQTNHTYEDDDVSISLASIFRFAKLAAVRVTLCVLAMILVATGTVAVWDRLHTRERVAQGGIEFFYAEIGQGLLPDGRTFRTGDLITIPTLKQAVYSAGLSQRLTDMVALESHIAVEAMYTAEVLELRERAATGNDEARAQALAQLAGIDAPSRFSVRLVSPQRLGLDRVESVRLLDEILVALKENFAAEYGMAETQFANDLFDTNLENFGFIDHYIRFRLEFRAISLYLTMRADQSPNFRSRDGVSFSDLAMMANAVDSSTFGGFVWDNQVVVDYTMELARLGSRFRALEGAISVLEEERHQIEILRGTTTTQLPDGATVTMINPATPEQVREISILNRRLSRYRYERAILVDIIGGIVRDINGEYKIGVGHFENVTANSSSTDIARATELLNAFSQEATELVGRINSIFEEYGSRSGDLVRTIVPVTHVTVVNRSIMHYLMFYVAMIFVGIAAGAAVTQFKIIKAKRKSDTMSISAE